MRSFSLQRSSVVLAALLAFTLAPLLRAQTASNKDQIAVYDMKVDPTLAAFVGVPSIEGFYGLGIDDYYNEGLLIFTFKDVVYHVRTGMKIKGDQITLTNKGKRKAYLRVEASANGPERIYPAECGPDRAGWRHGASFGRHLLRRNDESGIQIIVSNEKLELEIAERRCRDFGSDCGTTGCPEWEPLPSTATVSMTPKTSVPSPSPKATIPMAQALLDPKLGSTEFLATYKADIDAALPVQLTENVIAVTTGYFTTDVPYPGLDDPFIKQRGLKFGVISKSYGLEDKVSTMTVEIEPLSAEFQDPQPNKCGTWLSDPTKTFFDVRGHPALYQDGSTLFVCGNTVSISAKSTAPRTKEQLQTLVEALPFDQIERVVGGAK